MIQIHDMRPDRSALAVDLRDVFEVLGERAVRSMWLVVEEVYGREPIMATGAKTAGRLEELSRSGQRITGELLRGLAQQVTQVIWGEFQAYEGSARGPWLIVRAVDSTWYEVDTEDQNVLERLRKAFIDVREGDDRSTLVFGD